MRDRGGPPRVAPFLFFSGACALVYQVTWVRELRLIFGASTGASAAVLAVFMGGLGVGGVWLGKKIDASKTKPLVLYAHLELLIALSAALTPLMIFLAKKIYFGIGGSSTLGSGGATVLRLLLATLVLAVPTVLMGGTMPAAARAASARTDTGRTAVATLYGVNTCGAVAGAVLANFVLLEVLGNLLTLLITCLINVLVGIVARAVGRDSEFVHAVDGEAKGEGEAKSEDHDKDEGEGEAKDEGEAKSEGEGEGLTKTAGAKAAKAGEGVGLPMPLWFPPAAAGVSGFAFLLMELVWYRMLGPVLGGSSYTFGLILAAALLGIGIGGLLYAVAGRGRQASLNAFAITCALEALFIAIPYALGDRVAAVALLLRSLGTLGFLGHAATWSAVTAIVVVPAAVVSGYQFPLVIGLFGSGNKAVARHVGVAYAANTVGAIVGSLAGGFGLLPFLTATGCWRLVAYMLAATALVTFYLSIRAKERSSGSIVALSAALLAVFLSASAIGPTAAWRHTPIGAGRADAYAKPGATNSLLGYFNSQRRSIRWGVDGVESAVGLDTHMGTAFIVNGKSDGDARLDARTQVMGGLVGAALVPSPRRALVVGLGTGSTAGWLGAIPEMETVDVVELEPAILHVAKVCASANHDVLDNPKVHITIGDAREALLTSRGTYDVIFSEPSNPYRAGIASLYTVEFYQAGRSRLSDDGVFVQWIQAYEIDGAAIRVALVTLSQVFPTVSVWQTEAGDLLLIGAKNPRIDGARLQARVSSEPWKSAMKFAFRSEGVEGFLAHFLASSELTHRIVEHNMGLVNTDDRNLLEYAFARNVGRSKANVEDEFWRLSRAQKTDRPLLDGIKVDWAKVEGYRAEYTKSPMPENADERRFINAMRAYEAGDISRFAREYQALGRTPRTMVELEAAAEGLADLGSEAALPLIERLRAINEVEASLALTRLRLRQGKPTEAIEPFERAWADHRKDPWAAGDMAYRGLLLAEAFVNDKALGRRAYAALAEPFLLNSQDEERLLTRIRIAHAIDWPGLCVEAFQPFEEFPPWSFTFLKQRYDCHLTAHSPREAKAKEDLLDYMSRAPTTITGDLDTGESTSKVSALPKGNPGQGAAGKAEPDEPSDPTPQNEPSTTHVGPQVPSLMLSGDAGTASDAGAEDAEIPADAAARTLSRDH